MSSIQIATYLLTHDAGVKALVSNRIFPVEAPQKTAGDYIVVNRVSAKSFDLLDAAGKYYRDRVSIQAISKSALAADQIGKAAQDCLEAVVKRIVTDFNDVDIRFADVSVSDQNDAATAFRDQRQFFIWWRAK